MPEKLSTKPYRDLFFEVVKTTYPEYVEGKTKEEFWDMLKNLKLIELASAGAMGKVSMYGIESTSLMKSTQKKRPFLRRRISTMIQRIIQANAALCRASPSDDMVENARRIVALLDALKRDSGLEKAVPTDI
jgi:hypothetical protein